jgi:hypothetical protein
MLEGVTAAVVGFIFLCIAFPRLVKDSRPFYVALWVVIASIVLSSFRVMIQVPTFQNFAAGFTGLLLVLAILAMVMATGGFSIGELKENLIEVVRRGEQEKEYIVPLTGQKPRARYEDDDDEPRRERIELESPVIPVSPPPPASSPTTPPRPPESTGSIPLDE